MTNSYIITISGESGSGKSTLSGIISSKSDFVQVDVDKIISQIYQNSEFCKKLVKAFGAQILSNGKVDKKLVGKLVFENDKNQKMLTKISSPYINKQISEMAKQNRFIIVDYKFAPLLKIFKKANLNVLLVTTEKDRLEKLEKRDNLPKEYLLARDKNRLDYSAFHFDLVFNHTYDDLKKVANQILKNVK